MPASLDKCRYARRTLSACDGHAAGWGCSVSSPRTGRCWWFRVPAARTGIHRPDRVHRWGTGTCGARARRTLRASGNVGAIPPTKPRSIWRASAKFRPGSRCWTKLKMSPLASLNGSPQPRPSWLTITITISPTPRRYFRQRRVLSARSSRRTGGRRSSRPTDYDGTGFDPRAPCGARHDASKPAPPPDPFRSARPVRGATPDSCCCRSRICRFDPRAPCGARHLRDM